MDEEITQKQDETKRSLEKEANSKIMAINEYGLDLVVGDVDEGGVDLLAQLDDLSAHLVTQLGVEVGQRLVHQEDLRVPDDGAADSDTLALAAGQSLRLAVEVLGDIEDLGGLTE